MAWQLWAYLYMFLYIFSFLGPIDRTHSVWTNGPNVLSSGFFLEPLEHTMRTRAPCSSGMSYTPIDRLKHYWTTIYCLFMQAIPLTFNLLTGRHVNSWRRSQWLRRHGLFTCWVLRGTNIWRWRSMTAASLLNWPRAASSTPPFCTCSDRTWASRDKLEFVSLTISTQTPYRSSSVQHVSSHIPETRKHKH